MEVPHSPLDWSEAICYSRLGVQIHAFHLLAKPRVGFEMQGMVGEIVQHFLERIEGSMHFASPHAGHLTSSSLRAHWGVRQARPHSSRPVCLHYWASTQPRGVGGLAFSGIVLGAAASLRRQAATLAGVYSARRSVDMMQYLQQGKRFQTRWEAAPF